MLFRSPGIHSALALENDDRIIRSLLRNARLREHEVVAIVTREKTSAAVLRVVSSSERWVQRPPVRDRIVCHPNTPVHLALSLLRGLPRRTLGELLRRGELPRVVALRAAKMLEDGGAGGGRR